MSASLSHLKRRLILFVTYLSNIGITMGMPFRFSSSVCMKYSSAILCAWMREKLMLIDRFKLHIRTTYTHSLHHPQFSTYRLAHSTQNFNGRVGLLTSEHLMSIRRINI